MSGHDVIAYASRTGTRANLDLLREAGWRLLVSATGRLNSHDFPYAIDNGAWTAYQAGKPFDEKLFEAALDRMGKDADWTALPDIVMGGLRSLELSMRWMGRVLSGCQRALLPVQDGMEIDDVEAVIGKRVGIFIGGSTEWKLRTMASWSKFARSRDVWCHVGRVNGQKRIRSCQTAGVTSFDGSGVSKFTKVKLPVLDAQVRQRSFDFGGS